MVLASLPIALSGVAAAFLIAGEPFTREAAVGVIIVVGLAVNQTILLVDATLRRRLMGPLGRHAIVRAAAERSGMIVIVTATTLASLIPLAWGTGANSLFGAIALATARLPAVRCRASRLALDIGCPLGRSGVSGGRTTSSSRRSSASRYRTTMTP